MNDNPSETEHLARAVLKVLDREARKRPYDAAVVLGALGVAGAAVSAAAYPANGGIADGMMLAALGLGYQEAIGAMRLREGN